jgi:hypothetical protein
MPKLVRSFVVPYPASIVAAVIAFSMICSVHAADGCVERPNQQPTDGAHWYYHLDHAKHRKCWYLGTMGMTVSEAEAPAGQSGSAPMPTVSTLLSVLFSGMTGTATKGTPQDANIRQPRIIQPDAAKILKVDDIIQKRQPSIPEESAEERFIPRLNRARRNALFHDFLQAEEARRNTGGATPTQSP